jgi:hypothetical protein
VIGSIKVKQGSGLGGATKPPDEEFKCEGAAAAATAARSFLTLARSALICRPDLAEEAPRAAT